MIHHYIDIAMRYIEDGSMYLGDYLVPVVFLAALLESTPIIGTLTPGTLFLLLFGYAAFINGTNLGVIILVAAIGGVLGDLIGYAIGRYGGAWLIRHKKILKEVHIEQGRGFFSKHGGKSIFVGRFVGPIRPIVPLVAGSIRMSIKRFLFWNILSACLWATIYLVAGYFFGSYARTIESYVSEASIVVAVILAICGFFVYRHKKRQAKLGA